MNDIFSFVFATISIFAGFSMFAASLDILYNKECSDKTYLEIKLAARSLAFVALLVAAAVFHYLAH